MDGAGSARPRSRARSGDDRGAAALSVRRGPAPGRRPARSRSAGGGEEARGRAPGRGARTQGEGHRSRSRLPAAADPATDVGARDEETRKAIEAAHEQAIAIVLAWIEDDVAVIRYGAQGIHRTRPAHGLVAARFRHYEARSGMPLLHDHVLLSLKGLRPEDGVWGAVHSTALLESTVAASALYNEVVMAEACEALGLASEPRTVTPGRRPVMEVAGVPHELIRWTSRRSAQIAACLTDLEHEYVTATDDDGNLKFAPEVSERTRAKLNRIAARKTRPSNLRPRSLTQLREDWRASAQTFLAAGADLIDSLLERARAAAAAIRARVAAVVDVGLAAVAV
ncbi:MobF family relaxase, partial [Streptomyces sp. NBC_00872]|uniref:MobF family relaxase n=1 Tax=Streptomyces sp. NBC_00872 TaxID=2903686 RepID=UPI002F915D59